MLLPAVSLILFCYTALRVVAPMALPLPLRLGLAAVLLAASLKYAAYQLAGGSFFAPDLPRTCLLVMEALFAALVILACAQLLRDAAALALWLAKRCGLPPGATAWPSRTALSALLLGASLALGAWGAWQAVRVPGVRTVELHLPRLPEGLRGLSVVQLSDLHIRTLLDRDWLEDVVAAANALHPDIIAITGDCVDGAPAELADSLRPLGALRARLGVFGVLGNHEYYYGAAAWSAALEALGVDMLHNEHRVLSLPGGTLVVAGLTDPAAARFGGTGPDAGRAMAGAPPAAPAILLAHRPSGTEGTGADLQLSGHTHGGMLWFLQPLVARFNGGLVRGLYRRGETQVYVHPGTGLWGGFSCRLGVPAEITRCVLLPARQ